MLLVKVVVVLSLLATGFGVEEHEHPTLTWEILEDFVGGTFFITGSTVLSLPLDARLHCDPINGKQCVFPGYVNYAENHRDYRFDLSSHFYMFVNTFYITREYSGDVVTVKILNTVSKVKMLNVGCHKHDPMLDLPFGTKLFHDKDMQLELEGRHVPCTNRQYFLRYCPGGLNDFCFNEKLRVHDVGTLKGRKARAKAILSAKDEL